MIYLRQSMHFPSATIARLKRTPIQTLENISPLTECITAFHISFSSAFSFSLLFALPFSFLLMSPLFPFSSLRPQRESAFDFAAVPIQTLKRGRKKAEILNLPQTTPLPQPHHQSHPPPLPLPTEKMTSLMLRDMLLPKVF